MTRDLIRRGDNERLVFSETPLPQLTDVRVEGTYEVSLSEAGEADEVEAFEFDPNTSPAQARDYVFAAASGTLMGALSVLWQKDFNLADARKFGAEKIEKIVIGAAQRVGLKKENPSIADAIRFLEQIFPFAGDKLTDVFGGGLQHHLRDFSHHASPVGLVCSILMQFTGKGFGTTTDGSFAIFDLPAEALKDGRLFGRNVEEKFLYGTLNWVLHLISDMAGSSSTPGAGTGIPGPILSFLKEASALPFFRDMTIAHEDKVATFSQWVSKAFNGTLLKDQDGNPLRFDLRTEVGLASQILTQVPAVLANECIVRGFYTITRFIDELRRADVSSVKDLGRINPSRFLPLNSRALTRMLTVASGAFVVINTSIAAVRAAVAGAASGEVGAVPLFFMRLNYVGIGRFAFALWADRSYIYEDVEQWWERCQASKMGTDVAVHAPMGEEVQRVVESLRMLWLEDDCRREKNDKQRERKEVLIGAWVRRQRIAHDGSQGEYFLDAADAYRELEAACAGEDGELVRLAIAQQLLAYRPYATEKKLSLSQTWLTDVFTSDQDVIDSETLKRLKSARASYDRWLSGTYTKWAVRGAAAVAATVATGGVAAVAAPAIATVLAGEAVVGLSGAALTSASLAWVGGGSLAAGGLGMAGGTAIITGGGAVLGLTAASSGAALVGAFSKDYAERVKQGCIEWLAQCSVLLEESPAQALRAIEDSKARLERAIDADKRTIDALKGAKEKDEKKLRQSLNEGVSHLRYTVDELGKLEQKAREAAVERGDLAPSGSTDIARVPESD
ncbi:hypothetical protein [Schaalia odontolytica]|uniref:Uncharacterized protein n=2 Tax=Schaalia odontolytica TaxID=1660 RepID=A0A857A8R4_9ACTO|nr:hypothetical protein [Schaalia odontolytica]EFF80890.1 hypothetical protein HMPREF0970_00148 [Schaalia odontolytica F0309]QGS11559.1 hypothetical protein FOC40_09170 [Schaalia odontolytica]